MSCIRGRKDHAVGDAALPPRLISGGSAQHHQQRLASVHWTPQHIPHQFGAIWGWIHPSYLWALPAWVAGQSWHAELALKHKEKGVSLGNRDLGSSSSRKGRCQVQRSQEQSRNDTSGIKPSGHRDHLLPSPGEAQWG